VLVLAGELVVVVDISTVEAHRSVGACVEVIARAPEEVFAEVGDGEVEIRGGVGAADTAVGFELCRLVGWWQVKLKSQIQIVSATVM
jgi:hypothetical protein